MSQEVIGVVLPVVSSVRMEGHTKEGKPFSGTRLYVKLHDGSICELMDFGNVWAGGSTCLVQIGMYKNFPRLRVVG